MTIEFFIAGGVCILFLLLALYLLLWEKREPCWCLVLILCQKISGSSMIKPESVKTREIFSFLEWTLGCRNPYGLADFRSNDLCYSGDTSGAVFRKFTWMKKKHLGNIERGKVYEI